MKRSFRFVLLGVMLTLIAVVCTTFGVSAQEVIGGGAAITTLNAAPLIIKPNFNSVTNQVYFPTDKLNSFMRDDIRDNFSLYQARFNVFSWMKLTKNMTYVLYNISGQPFMWQTHNSCGWDPTGSIWTGQREVTPVKAKINEENCYDELFGSAFDTFLDWDGRGPVKFDANGRELWNQLTTVLVQNAVLGALTSLTVGQLHTANPTFSSATPSNIQQLWSKTIGTVKGWVQLLKERSTAAGMSHLNISGLFDASKDFDGHKYIGNVLTLFDNIKSGSPAELGDLINEGAINAYDSNSMNPQMLCSTSIYNAVVEYFNQNRATIVIDPRVTRQEETVNGQKFYVYYIDSIPVIPVKYSNVFEKYLTGRTHFAYIQSNGNISLGGSFANLPEVNGRPADAGVMLQQGNDAKDYGKYYFLAHQLMATQIADTDYIAGGQIFATPS